MFDYGYYAPVDSHNLTDIIHKIYLYECMPVKPFDSNEFEIYHGSIDSSLSENNPKADITQWICTLHMNNEEKYTIEKLCQSFSDILHSENAIPTFTN
ncbi:hypothetical protein JTB14_022393 [Gonioctena quinquepunctata]|nr:hypothetical protein JTB14_022393 [Gonioctena quinquepunctata]